MDGICRWCCHRFHRFKPLTRLTLKAESDEAGELYGGKVASDLQEDVVVDGNKISGTLKFIEGGLAPSGYLAGDGYFLALHWGNPDTDATSLKVGLNPSAGSGLIECIDDTDRNGVFKIADPKKQKFIILSSNDEQKTKQTFDLSGLVFADAEG